VPSSGREGYSGAEVRAHGQFLPTAKVGPKGVGQHGVEAADSDSVPGWP
jgi:hypothetical protein